MGEMKQFATDSLVDTIKRQAGTTAPQKSAATSKPGTTSAISSVSLEPMTLELATKLVRRLLAGYPNLGAHDPDGYFAAMIAVMAEYPAWAGERTILKVDVENTSFPPSDKTLRTWLEDAVRPYRFVAEWNERAKQQLAEREQIEAEREGKPEAPQEQRGTILTNFTEAVAAHGRPFGAFEAGRRLVYRG